MGFKKDWDTNAMQHWIQIMGYNCRSPYNDGFVHWDIKQELYKLKWMVDEQLAKSSSFSGEKEWLEEVEKQKVWDTLNEV